MRILGTSLLSAYVRQKPHTQRSLLAFRALVSAASWSQFKDVEAQFGKLATFNPPDRVTFELADEDLSIEMRVNFALGLALVVKSRSAKRERENKMNEPIHPIRNE